MEKETRKWLDDLEHVLNEFKAYIVPKPNQLLVVGCSTSEIMGKKIGTSGSLNVAEELFTRLYAFTEEMGLSIAVQCCEHLNRALVVERHVQKNFQFEEVTVIPVPNAGGAMASYAFRHLNDPVVVEAIKADYGMDIGDTLIGMHLKHVAVPVRLSHRKIGSANVTLAKTRPKLIGGERAVYHLDD